MNYSIKIDLLKLKNTCATNLKGTINIKVGPEPIVFEAKASTWADDLEINHSAN